jgi:hypothetical protein
MAVTPAPGIHLAARGTFVPPPDPGLGPPVTWLRGGGTLEARSPGRARSAYPSRLVLGPGMPPTPGPEDETPGTCFGKG